MCGIAGFFRPGGLAASVSESIVEGLSETLLHRGPDDAGTWVDGDAGIALGHRRLAVLDLSAAGHQPMISASGRYVIVFNGEIYNHLEIRREIETRDPLRQWRGHSDTETLLAGFDSWRVEPTLKRAVGMFAFALWDRQDRVLTLSRDRMGEKPLYYGWQGDVLLFGSELKALRAHPDFRPEIDRNVVAGYMRRGYIAAPNSIYRNVFKLLPGTYLELSPRQVPGTFPSCKPYWSLRVVAESGLDNPFDGSDFDAVGVLEEHLKRALSLQSIADVSLGAFLSGGIDSSTVVALMQAQSSTAVKTFTIGSCELAYQEAEHAKTIAQHLGTDHTEMYVTAREALEVIPKLPDMYDEPFGDSSAIPTFLVSQLARKHVTVSLSGDGGDELFGGYTRYQRTEDIWRAIRRIPYGVRNVMSGGIRALSRHVDGSSLGWKANRLALYLAARKGEDCYDAQILQRYNASVLVLGIDRASSNFGPPAAALSQGHLYSDMMYRDASTYLPDDVLTKVDRASMAVSLEVRVPMLDHRLVEFAWRLPFKMKVRSRESKWLLRQILQKYVPKAMIDRPKMGFGIPIGQWLRGPLRSWAEDLLSEDRVRRDGLLDPHLVRAQWLRHIGGRSDGVDSLWQVLAFQAWHAQKHRALRRIAAYGV
jgi:asparagine synthase (glutamine-hydrolysing)